MDTTTPFLSIKSNANLVILENGAVRTVPLDSRTEWTIGRSAPGNEIDIVLNSKIVSRQHGKLVNLNEQWFFSDNGSANGTYYNGEKILADNDGNMFPVSLSNGDILRIDSNNLLNPDSRGVWMMFSSHSHANVWNTVALEKDETSFGRDEDICDVVIPLSYISGKHFVIRRKGNKYYVMDCDSMAGTWLNNDKVLGEIELHEKDCIAMCDCTFIFTGESLIYNLPARKKHRSVSKDSSMHMEAVNITPPVPAPSVLTQAAPEAEVVPLFDPMTGEKLNITSQTPVDMAPQEESIPLYDPMTGERLTPSSETIPVVERSASAGKVIVSYDPMTGEPIYGATSDEISNPVSDIMYVPNEAYIIPEEEKEVILRADIKTKVVPNNSGIGEKELIRDVKVEVKESSLVALLGGSGAGKSTVMNCLNGMETKGVTGTIEYQGVDLLKNFERMKYLIGSVPQEQVFHPSLTVESELRHAAKRRLPGDTKRKEIKEHVDLAIEQLKLTNIRKNKICKCSGGEQKRVNIGIELVADRQLLCLDEPDAGLDPGTKKELFTILRNLAHEENKSILVIIHDVSDIDLFDQIIMMTKIDNVGRLAFSGTPAEAREYFGADIKEAYGLLATHPEKYVKGV